MFHSRLVMGFSYVSFTTISVLLARWCIMKQNHNTHFVCKSANYAPSRKFGNYGIMNNLLDQLNNVHLKPKGISLAKSTFKEYSIHNLIRNHTKLLGLFCRNYRYIQYTLRKRAKIVPLVVQQLVTGTITSKEVSSTLKVHTYYYAKARDTLHDFQLSRTKDWHRETIEAISVILAPNRWCCHTVREVQKTAVVMFGVFAATIHVYWPTNKNVTWNLRDMALKHKTAYLKLLCLSLSPLPLFVSTHKNYNC